MEEVWFVECHPMSAVGSRDREPLVSSCSLRGLDANISVYGAPTLGEMLDLTVGNHR